MLHRLMPFMILHPPKLQLSARSIAKSKPGLSNRIQHLPVSQVPCIQRLSPVHTLPDVDREVYIARVWHFSFCAGGSSPEADAAVFALHAFVAAGDCVADFYLGGVYFVVLA